MQVLNDVYDLEGQVFLHAWTENSCSSTPLEHTCDSILQTATTNETIDPSLNEDKQKSILYNSITKPISVSLYFFHIMYRVSDRGINFILLLLCTVINSIGIFLKNDLLMFLSSQIPQNIYQLSKIIGSNKHNIAVCLKYSACYSLARKSTSTFNCSVKLGYKVCNTEFF